LKDSLLNKTSFLKNKDQFNKTISDIRLDMQGKMTDPQIDQTVQYPNVRLICLTYMLTYILYVGFPKTRKRFF
jgi:hypothetical protein